MILTRAGRPPSPGRRLLTESGSARGYLTITTGLGLGVAVMVLAQAWLLSHALAYAARGFGARAMTVTFAVLLGVVLARAIALYGGEYAALRAAAAVKDQLRGRLLGRTLRNGPAWLGRQRTGEITMLATSGLDALDPYFSGFLPQLLLAVAVPGAVLLAVTAADWLSGLIIAITLPLIPLFGALVGWHTKARTSQSWRLLATLSGHFLDVVQGITTLVTFGRAKAQERVIERITEEYRLSVMATLRVAFLSSLVLELAASVATALVAVEVGLRLRYGQLGYPTALFVLLLTPEAFLPLRNVAAQFHASADGQAAASRVFEILDQPAPPPAVTLPGRVPDLRSETLRLDDVSLRYPRRDDPALDHCDLSILPGDRITLVGHNGAGKSSLLRLLLKFEVPAGGTLTAGGIELSEVPAGAWREQIAWLPQHPTLFPWSVAENIALGRPAATRAEVERAAFVAGAAEFIAALPDGYDTRLGERALELSAGQRQKIALARTLLRESPLVLLDEPFAHLDPRSAADLDAVLTEGTAGRTVIIVSHRQVRSSVSGRLLTLTSGRLTELVPADPLGEPVASR